MAAGFGGAIKLTGESEYRRALSQITQSLREVSSEMKTVASAYASNDNSTEALAKKSQNLTKQLELEKQKLSTLQGQYESMSKRYDAQGKAHDELTQKYETEKRKLDEIGKSLGTSSSEYEKQKNVVDQYKDAVQKSATNQDANAKSLSNMRIKMNDAQTSINKTEGELKKLDSQMENAEKATEDMGKAAGNAKGKTNELGDAVEDAGNKAKASEGGFTVLKGAIANVAGNIIQSAISGIQGLASEAISSSDALKKFESTMQFAGYDGATIDKAKSDMKTYADKTVYDLQTVANTTAQLAANGVPNFEQLTEAAGNLNAVAGGNQDTFQSVAMVLTQTAGAGKLTTENWNQLSDAIPGASGKIQEALKKNGAYTGNFRDAMEKGEISADEFNQAIMSLGFTDAAQKAATSTDTFEGAMGNMQAAVTDGLMQIYDAIGSENVTGFINGISDAVSAVIPPIKTAVQWFMDNLPVIGPLLAAIGTALGAIMIAQQVEAMVTAFNSWKAATEGLTIAQQLLNAVQLASPIGLIVAAIAAAVAAIVVLWNTNEGFRDFVTNAWNNIQSVIGNVVSAIGGFFTETIPSAIQSMLTFFQDLPGNLSGLLGDALNAVATWAGEMASNALSAGSQFLQNVLSFLNNLPYNIGYLLGLAIGSVISWVGQMATNAASAGSQFLTNVVNFLTQLPGRIANFLSSVISNVGSWAAQMASNASRAGSQFLQNVVNFLTQLPGRIAGLLGQVISHLASWASSMGSKGAEGARRLFNAVVDGIKGLPGRVASIGKNIVHGIWNGISGAAGWLAGKVKSFASGILDGMKSALGIHSPSTVFRDEVGKYLAEGIGVGFSDEMQAVAADMQGAIPTSFDVSTDVTAGGQAASYGNVDIVDAFKEALSQMKIVLDDDEVGRFVDRTVSNLVYS